MRPLTTANRQLTTILLLIPPALLGTLSSAWARDLQVDPSGSGTACTAQSPCADATAAERAGKTFDVSTCSEFRDTLNDAGNQDVIQFAKGNYRCAFDTKRDGVTFRGADGHGTRLLWSDGSSGKQIIGIRHDRIILDGLEINGEKRNNSGHGLVRVGSSRGVRIINNRIINSGSSNLNIGGSIKESYIYDIEVRGNYICGSGFTDKYGEAIYVSDYAGSGRTDGIRIVGNEICDATDNFIDLKPPTRNAIIHHNYFHDQVNRQGQQNYGAIVSQGEDIVIDHNVFEDVDGGVAVFNLTSSSDVKVMNNVITDAKADWMVRNRGGGDTSPTRVEANLFCDVSTRKTVSSSGFVVRNNAGLDAPTQACGPQMAIILAAMKKYQTDIPPLPSPGPEPEPEPEPRPIPLPTLRIVKITYGETAPFSVRVYTATVDPEADAQMNEREYREGSVLFYSLDHEGLSFYRQKRAPSKHPDGWNFYLDEPYPDANIRMVAETGWITMAPAIDQLIPRWGKPEPEPDPEPDPKPEPEPMPIINLDKGQKASCLGEMTLSEPPGMFPGTLTYAQCGDTGD